jgi:hypothetical protein
MTQRRALRPRFVGSLVIRCSMLAAASGTALFGDAPAMAAEPTKDDCIDANEAAQTLTRSARLREAKRNLLVCIAASCPGPVREDCAQQLSQVDLKIPTLVFEAKDEAGHDLSAVKVMMDDQTLVDTLDGTAIPLDPGEHRFLFQSEGRKDETRTLLLHEGEKDRRERIVMRPSGGSALNGEPTAAGHESAAVSASKERPKDGQTQRMIGLGVGGAGAAAAIVGAIFGIVAKSTFDDARNKCGGDSKNCASPEGFSEGQTAYDQATVSDVAFVGAAALLGAGAYLYFTAPRAGTVSVAPSVGAGGGGVSIHGWW